MMQAKRTTYAARSGNNEITKLGLEIKQIIKQLQEDLKKKDKILDDYTKAIQSFNREYQTLSTKKNKLKDFLQKQEQEKQRAKQDSLIKQHATTKC